MFPPKCQRGKLKTFVNITSNLKYENDTKLEKWHHIPISFSQ